MASWFGVDVAFNPPMSCSGLCGPPSSHLVQIGNHPHSGCFRFCLIVLISFSKTIEMRFCIYNLTSNSQIENKWIKTWTEGRLHSMNINHHTPMGLSDDLSIAFIGKYDDEISYVLMGWIRKLPIKKSRCAPFAYPITTMKKTSWGESPDPMPSSPRCEIGLTGYTPMTGMMSILTSKCFILGKVVWCWYWFYHLQMVD